MWDRLRTTSSPTAITAPEERFQGRHPGGVVHKHSMTQMRTRVARPGRTHGLDLDSDNFLEPLNALGISNNANGPNRFAIQRGKVVPRRQNVDIILPSQNDFGSVHPEIVPPRRSSRRKQRQHQHHHRRQSSSRRQSNPAWRPASSVYDSSDREPSPLTPQYKLASSNRFGGAAADQISPPSSPEFSAVQHGLTAGDVSPIDDELDHIQQESLRGSRQDTHSLPSQQQPRTSIPKPNRGQQRNVGGVEPGPQELRSTGGRAWNQQVHTGRVLTPPDSDALRQPRGTTPSFGLNTPAVSPEHERATTSSPSNGQRIHLAGKTKPDPVESRPPWNGASGRSTMVEPVRDDFNVAPLSIPRKSSKRPGRSARPSASAVGSETSGLGGAGSAMRRLLPLSSKNRTRKSASLSTQLPTEGQLRNVESSYPSPPHAEFPVSEPRSRNTPPPNWHNQALASHPPEPRHSLNAIKRKPPPPSAQASPASTYLAPNAKSSDGAGSSTTPTAVSPARADDTWVPPPSRFSITTYATSASGTPRQSAEENLPPLPTLPSVGVMDRSRPVAGGRSRQSSSDEPIVIEMSSPYTPVEAVQSRSSDLFAQGQHYRAMSDTKSTDRRASTLSMSKPLPPPPSEMTPANDRVSHLNAQINGLVHRRVNIERSIKQMTELMPQDNLLASDQVLRKREEEKQKVDGLREELAEIQREEYDLGLKLFRAYKRQDKDAEYEPTTLWVRRVAG